MWLLVLLSKFKMHTKNERSGRIHGILVAKAFISFHFVGIVLLWHKKKKINTDDHLVIPMIIFSRSQSWM